MEEVKKTEDGQVPGRIAHTAHISEIKVEVEPDPSGKNTPEAIVKAFPLPTLDLLLFYLWTYAGDSGLNASQREAVLESFRRIKAMGIERLELGKIRLLPEDKGMAFAFATRPKSAGPAFEQEAAHAWVRLAVAQIGGIGKEFLALMRTPVVPGSIKMGRHLASNMLGGSDPQLPIPFPELLDRYAKEAGMDLWQRPKGMGLSLNAYQQDTLQGILSAFSDLDYRSDDMVEAGELLGSPSFEQGTHSNARTGAGSAGAMYRKAYANAPRLPRIRLTLAEVVRRAGYDPAHHRDRDKVREALDYLSTACHGFYWHRKAYRRAADGSREPELDAKGKHKAEEVYQVGTLLDVRHVMEEDTKVLKYFEITPSAVVVDQVTEEYRGPFFLMVPADLRARVKSVIKGRRDSSDPYVFILYLIERYRSKQASMERKAKERGGKRGEPWNGTYTLKPRWDDLARHLNMTPNVYRRNPSKALGRLDLCYTVAKELGYLKSYSMDGEHVRLTLDPKAYYTAGREDLEGSTQGRIKEARK